MGKKLEAKNFTKLSSVNLLGEHNKMVAPHIKRRRRLAKIEESMPAPENETETLAADLPEADLPEADLPEPTPKKEVRFTYKKKED